MVGAAAPIVAEYDRRGEDLAARAGYVDAARERRYGPVDVHPHPRVHKVHPRIDAQARVRRVTACGELAPQIGVGELEAICAVPRAGGKKEPDRILERAVAKDGVLLGPTATLVV